MWKKTKANFGQKMLLIFNGEYDFLLLQAQLDGMSVNKPIFQREGNMLWQDKVKRKTCRDFELNFQKPSLLMTTTIDKGHLKLIEKLKWKYFSSQ